jgi:hypothetical protein
MPRRDPIEGPDPAHGIGAYMQRLWGHLSTFVYLLGAPVAILHFDLGGVAWFVYASTLMLSQKIDGLAETLRRS